MLMRFHAVRGKWFAIHVDTFNCVLIDPLMCGMSSYSIHNQDFLLLFNSYLLHTYEK